MLLLYTITSCDRQHELALQQSLVKRFMEEELAVIEFSPLKPLEKAGAFSANVMILDQQVEVVFAVDGDQVTSDFLNAVREFIETPLASHLRKEFPFAVEPSEIISVAGDGLSLTANANINEAYRPEFNIYCPFKSSAIKDDLLKILQKTPLYLRAPGALLIEPSGQVLEVTLNGVAPIGTEVLVGELGKPGVEEAMVLVQTKEGDSGWVPTWFLSDIQPEQGATTALPTEKYYVFLRGCTLLPYPTSTPVEANTIALSLPQGTVVTLLARYDGWLLVQTAPWGPDETTHAGWVSENDIRPVFERDNSR